VQLDPFFENDLARQLVAKSERYKSGYWVIKMFVWRFEEYSKLVFLDGDIYFRQSADQLFCAPVSAEVRAPLTKKYTVAWEPPSHCGSLCEHMEGNDPTTLFKIKGPQSYWKAFCDAGQTAASSGSSAASRAPPGAPLGEAPGRDPCCRFLPPSRSARAVQLRS
jgi:hypothetical protein